MEIFCRILCLRDSKGSPETESKAEIRRVRIGHKSA